MEPINKGRPPPSGHHVRGASSAAAAWKNNLRYNALSEEGSYGSFGLYAPSPLPAYTDPFPGISRNEHQLFAESREGARPRSLTRSISNSEGLRRHRTRRPLSELLSAPDHQYCPSQSPAPAANLHQQPLNGRSSDVPATDLMQAAGSLDFEYRAQAARRVVDDPSWMPPVDNGSHYTTRHASFAPGAAPMSFPKAGQGAAHVYLPAHGFLSRARSDRYDLDRMLMGQSSIFRDQKGDIGVVESDSALTITSMSSPRYNEVIRAAESGLRSEHSYSRMQYVRSRSQDLNVAPMTSPLLKGACPSNNGAGIRHVPGGHLAVAAPPAYINHVSYDDGRSKSHVQHRRVTMRDMLATDIDHVTATDQHRQPMSNIGAASRKHSLDNYPKSLDSLDDQQYRYRGRSDSSAAADHNYYTSLRTAVGEPPHAENIVQVHRQDQLPPLRTTTTSAAGTLAGAAPAGERHTITDPTRRKGINYFMSGRDSPASDIHHGSNIGLSVGHMNDHSANTAAFRLDMYGPFKVQQLIPSSAISNNKTNALRFPSNALLDLTDQMRAPGEADAGHSTHACTRVGAAEDQLDSAVHPSASRMTDNNPMSAPATANFTKGHSVLDYVIENIVRKLILLSEKHDGPSFNEAGTVSAKLLFKRVLLVQIQALAPMLTDICADQRQQEAHSWALKAPAPSSRMNGTKQSAQLSRHEGLSLLHLQRVLYDTGISTFDTLMRIRGSLVESLIKHNNIGAREEMKIACVGGAPGCAAMALRLFFLMMRPSWNVKVDVWGRVEEGGSKLVEEMRIMGIEWVGMESGGGNAVQMVRKNAGRMRSYRVLVMVNCADQGSSSSLVQQCNIVDEWRHMWERVYESAGPGAVAVVYESSWVVPGCMTSMRWDDIAPSIAPWHFAAPAPANNYRLLHDCVRLGSRG